MALTDKQRAFVDSYLQNFNATQAAIDAGYSEKTARAIGSENLTKPDIIAAIAEHFRCTAMSRDEAMARLTDYARIDMAAFIRVNDRGDPIPDFREAKAAGRLRWVRKFRMGDKGDVSFELHDPLKALAIIAKHHKLVAGGPQDTDDDGDDDTEPDEINADALTAEAALAAAV